MALFRETNELSRQNLRRKPFSKTTGIRKFGLNIMGYNDDGTKNAWGNINPMNIAAPGLSHAYAEGLASGDTKEVLKENRSEAIGSQLASLKLASNFIPGVGLAGRIGMSAGLGVASNLNKNQQVEEAVKNTEAFEQSGSAIVNEALRSQSMDTAKDELNTAMDASTIMDEVDEVAVDDYANYTAGTDGGGVTKGVGGAAKGAKLAKGLGTAANIAAIGSDVFGMVGAQKNYNQGLKKSKKNLMKKKQNPNTTFNYL